MDINMEKTKDLKNSKALAEEIVKILLEKKGVNVKLFDVTESTSITDYYVNATGRSSTQVLALADDVVDKIAELGREKLHVEGKSGNAWVLVDFGDVIVNIFDRETREFYSFDRHLPEGSERDISELVAEVDKKFALNNSAED